MLVARRADRAPLVVSRYGDVTAPPLLFRRALFGELLADGGRVRQGGRAGAQTRGDVCDRPVTLLTDVDTPEDFAAAIAAQRPTASVGCAVSAVRCRRRCVVAVVGAG